MAETIHNAMIKRIYIRESYTNLGKKMGCSKARLLALLQKISDEMDDCSSVECCKSIIQTYIDRIKELSYRELDYELFNL